MARRSCGRANVVALELAVERSAADAQHASGERLVAFDLLEDALDLRAQVAGVVDGLERERLVREVVAAEVGLAGAGGSAFMAALETCNSEPGAYRSRNQCTS